MSEAAQSLSRIPSSHLSTRVHVRVCPPTLKETDLRGAGFALSRNQAGEEAVLQLPETQAQRQARLLTPASGPGGPGELRLQGAPPHTHTHPQLSQ